MNIKVKDGTPVGNYSICNTCSWGLVMKGFRTSEELVYCMRPYPDVIVPFPVRECSSYDDKTLPSKEDMEKTAWILLSKQINRKVGFVKRDEFQRIFGDDVNIIPE
jgi:hypothetical protein